MHGTTKEVNRLVSASCRLALGRREGASASEDVYVELLASLAYAKPFARTWSST